MERYAEADVPTEYGLVRTVIYRDEEDEHIALVVGDLSGEEPVLSRVHSECWTGEVMRSLKCDCRAQLDLALKGIEAQGRGVVVYLRQEGRGIGLGNKVRAYALQAEGADTVEANRMLGLPDDDRTYDTAAFILRDLGVKSVALMTNNPLKVKGLEQHGITVTERVPLLPPVHEQAASYLEVKAKKMGHQIE